jgi:hypothetical protein
MYDHKRVNDTHEELALTQILNKLDELDIRLAKMEKYLERQKGFIGGILLVASIFAWLISEAKDWWK